MRSSNITLVRIKCIADPNTPTAYKDFAKANFQKITVLCQVAHRLCVLGAADEAAAILRLCTRPERIKHTEAAGLEPLAARIAVMDFPISAIRTLNKILRPSANLTARQRKIFADFLIRVAVLKSTQSAIDDIFSTLNVDKFTIQQTYSLSKMCAKFCDPRAIELSARMLRHFRRLSSPDPKNLRAVAQRYLWSIFRVRGAASLLREVETLDDPTVREVFDSGYRSLFLFATGQFDAATEASRSITPELGLIFNGARLYPKRAQAAEHIQDIPVNSSLPVYLDKVERIAVLLSCDPVYLELFALSYLDRFVPPMGPQCEVIIFVNGAVDAGLCEELSSRCRVPVRFVINPRPGADKAFYTLKRFVEIPKVLRNHDLVIATDIDVEVDLSDIEFVDTLGRNAGGWTDTGNELPWLRHHAGLVYFANTREGDWASRSLARLASRLYQPRTGNQNWFIDQVCLAVLWDSLPAASRKNFGLLPPTRWAPHFKQVEGISLDPRRRLRHKVKQLSRPARPSPK